MKFEWDEGKRRANLAKHGSDFANARGFEFETAVINVDDRFDYGEIRYQALGLIGGTLHMLVFTWRNGTVRVISLRKANRAERNHYAQGTSAQGAEE